jgi:hypothetical protein
MNLHRLLAENMARFGTKNLPGSTIRTILNEGYSAGAQVAKLDATEINAKDGATPAIAQYLGKYASTNIKTMGGQSNTMTWVAAHALCYATYNWAQTDKEVKKLQNKANQIIQFGNIWNAIGGSELFTAQGDSGTALQKLVVDKASELTTQITYNNTKVDIYPSPAYPNMVATVGRAFDDVVNNVGKQTQSPYNALIMYMNTFNLQNISDDAPDFTQYVLSDMLTAENFVDMQVTVSANNKIYVYTPGTKTPDVAGKELTTTTVGASAPVPKQYDVSFESDSTAIPANDSEVARAVQDAITMFPDGNITNITVVSSASPEYNERGGGPKTLADYGQTPITGTGDPGAGTGFIGKNIKLAYDRGVSFMAALNAGLEAQGKPAVSGYTIKWQISDKGGSKEPGRYAEVQWEKAGSKGTEVPGVKSTGTQGTTTGGIATFDITQHEFTF